MRGMLMSLTTMSMSRLPSISGERLDAVTREEEADRAVADLAAEFLDDQRLEVRLVVDDEDARCHAASPEPRFDLAAQRGEVDRLGQQRLGAVLQRLALGLGIAIGGDHDDRHIRARRLRLRQQLQPAHARHVDVGEDQDQRHAFGVARSATAPRQPTARTP